MRTLKLLLLSATILCIGCKRQSNNQIEGLVTIQLFNKEVHFAENVQSSQRYRAGERKRAMNLIQWKITNNSNERLLFIFDGAMFNKNPFESENMRIEIFNALGKNHAYASDITWSEKEHSTANLWECESYYDSIVRSNYEILGVKKEHFYLNKSFTENSFILHPNESHSFISNINLPIIKEIEPRSLKSGISTDKIQSGSSFIVVYECNATKMKAALMPYQLEQLAENKIKIFDGTVKSNAIPVVAN